MKSLEEKIDDVILDHLGLDIDELEFCDKALDAIECVQYGLELRRSELADDEFDDKALDEIPY